MRYLMAVLAVLLSGCNDNDINDIKKGELRHTIFVECMRLASKMPRQADDDVSDVVSERSTQAWYMANQKSK